VLVESTQDAVRRVVASEAPRSGWLGNVDFAVDFAALSKQLLRDSERRHPSESYPRVVWPEQCHL